METPDDDHQIQTYTYPRQRFLITFNEFSELFLNLFGIIPADTIVLILTYNI